MVTMISSISMFQFVVIFLEEHQKKNNNKIKRVELKQKKREI